MCRTPVCTTSSWGVCDMGFEIKTDRAKWKATLEAGAEAASAALAEQMMSDSRDKIPDDGEHTLRDIGRIERVDAGERDLVWSNVDAAYQWHGMRVDGTHVVENYTTPGTGKAWVDTARAENKEKWGKVAQNAFAKGMGT